MLLLKRRQFKHLSGAPANDQRAFLEAALMTLSVDSRRQPDQDTDFVRISSRIQWKLRLEVEIDRILTEIGRAHDDVDRMFSFIDGILDRTSSPETRAVILDLCHILGDHDCVNKSFESAYLTRLQQKLAS